MVIPMFEQVEEFHKKILDLPTHSGGLPMSRVKFRIEHLQEELDEIKLAAKCIDEDGNIHLLAREDFVDGLIDLIYVAIGTLLEGGVKPNQAFDAVHLANMAKVRGVTKRGSGYDAKKPDGWVAPDHSMAIEEAVTRWLVSPAFLEATRIRETRGAMYNQGAVQRKDHFILGDAGFMQMIWIKVIRMRSEVEGGNVSPERMSEHLRDLNNYAAFWWEFHNGGVR